MVSSFFDYAGSKTLVSRFSLTDYEKYISLVSNLFNEFIGFFVRSLGIFLFLPKIEKSMPHINKCTDIINLCKLIR